MAGPCQVKCGMGDGLINETVTDGPCPGMVGKVQGKGGMVKGDDSDGPKWPASVRVEVFFFFVFIFVFFF